MKHSLGLCVIGLFCIASLTVAKSPDRLINGEPVDKADWPEVIRLSSSGCTATIVGPRVVITAAHCAGHGAKVTFSAGGEEYSGKAYRHPQYTTMGYQYDIVAAVIDEDIDVPPASVGGTAEEDLWITLLGYGCIYPGGGGGNDGILRMGKAQVKSLSGTDMVSSGGAALCFGDSGGPAFVLEEDKRLLLGVNSKGNISNTNWNLRTDLPEIRSFLEDIGSEKNVDICGINTEC